MKLLVEKYGRCSPVNDVDSLVFLIDERLELVSSIGHPSHYIFLVFVVIVLLIVHYFPNPNTQVSAYTGGEITIDLNNTQYSN